MQSHTGKKKKTHFLFPSCSVFFQCLYKGSFFSNTHIIKLVFLPSGCNVHIEIAQSHQGIKIENKLYIYNMGVYIWFLYTRHRMTIVLASADISCVIWKDKHRLIYTEAHHDFVLFSRKQELRWKQGEKRWHNLGEMKF